jgi:hypothetical protein
MPPRHVAGRVEGDYFVKRFVDWYKEGHNVLSKFLMKGDNVIDVGASIVRVRHWKVASVPIIR